MASESFKRPQVPEGVIAQDSAPAIRIQPCDHLIELATKAIWRNCDPDPNGQIPFGFAINA